MRILIVEDVDEMRVFLKEALSRIGHHVEEATTTAEARNRIARNRPELILLDELLPGESGLDLLPELIGVRVLLISGFEGPRALPNGVIGRLIKKEWRKDDEFYQEIAPYLAPLKSK